jgi:ribonuclease T2
MQKDWPSLACPSSDGVRFWSHEWEKHGTCSLLNEHKYFKTALDLKEKANLLQVLKDAGIEPNGELYSLESIKDAIKEGVGYTPFIECNVDQSSNHQIYQVYLCVDSSAKDFIECPVFPHGRCGSQVEFPSFSSSHDEF